MMAIVPLLRAGKARFAAIACPRARTPDDPLVHDQPLPRNRAGALRQILKAEIHRFDGQATRHKKMHRRLASSVIILTAATTILAAFGLAVEQRYGRNIQFGVVALTAVTTAVSAWSELRKASELWRHEREIAYALRDILRELDYRSATASISDDALDACFERASAMISASSSKWRGIHDPLVQAHKPEAAQS
jgi:hypothetical protein